MPIEFRCTQCNKLLRTPDETAGKQAQCPECGALVTIPSPGAAPGPPGGGEGAVPPPPPPGTGSGSPFASGGPESPEVGDPNNPYRSPADYGATPAAGPQPAGFVPTQIEVGDVFSRAWEIFKDQWGTCLITVIVVAGLNFLVNIVVGLAGGLAQAITGEEIVGGIVNLVGNLGGTLFSVWISIGQTLIFLNIARGREASVGDIFSGGPYFITILLASILFGLICLVGYILCVVPGVILALMFSQFYYLILDRNAGVMESLETSKEITTGNKMTLFVIGLLCFLLVIVAIIPCGLGLIVAAPFFALLGPVVYLRMTGQPTADQLRPGPVV